jgi:hypothetical protein
MPASWSWIERAQSAVLYAGRRVILYEERLNSRTPYIVAELLPEDPGGILRDVSESTSVQDGQPIRSFASGLSGSTRNAHSTRERSAMNRVAASRHGEEPQQQQEMPMVTMHIAVRTVQ